MGGLGLGGLHVLRLVGDEGGAVLAPELLEAALLLLLHQSTATSFRLHS